MALTLIHPQFKLLLDTAGVPVYPMMIPTNADMPAIAYKLDDIVRDSESSLGGTDLVAHTYEVTVVSKTFPEMQSLAQSVINKLDCYTDELIFFATVEGASDSYDPDFGAYTSTITVSVRTKEI